MHTSKGVPSSLANELALNRRSCPLRLVSLPGAGSAAAPSFSAIILGSTYRSGPRSLRFCPSVWCDSRSQRESQMIEVTPRLSEKHVKEKKSPLWRHTVYFSIKKTRNVRKTSTVRGHQSPSPSSSLMSHGDLRRSPEPGRRRRPLHSACSTWSFNPRGDRSPLLAS